MLQTWSTKSSLNISELEQRSQGGDTRELGFQRKSNGPAHHFLFPLIPPNPPLCPQATADLPSVTID